MNVACLENTAEVGFIRRPRAETFDGRLLVTERFKERVGELRGIKGPLREVSDGLFDFYGVHGFRPNVAFFVGRRSTGGSGLFMNSSSKPRV